MPHRLVRLADRMLEGLACLLLASLFTVVLLGVVTRALGEPLIWTDEGARFLMIWLATTGWIIAGRRRAHVRIRYFQGLLPAGARRAVEGVIRLALAGFGLVVAWYSVTLVLRNAELEATTLPLAMAWFYVPMVPAGAALLIQALAEFAELWRPQPRPAGSPIGEAAIE